MSQVRSPFLSFEHFISPASCEKLIGELGISVPSIDETGRPLKNERILRDGEHMLMFKSLMQERVGQIEERYNASVVGMEPPVFSQYFENPKDPCELHGCENAKFLRK